MKTVTELAAGRELDALVAEKVMGLYPCPICENDPTEPHLGIPDDGLLWHSAPYSTDIAAAWEVVEKLGWPAEIRYHPKTVPQYTVSLNVYSPPGGVGQAEKLPLAICLAALKAVGE